MPVSIEFSALMSSLMAGQFGHAFHACAAECVDIYERSFCPSRYIPQAPSPVEPGAQQASCSPSATRITTSFSAKALFGHSQKPKMPLLMSRNDNSSVDLGGSALRTRSCTPSRRSKPAALTSQKAAELKARYEMAQAIQKPWPLHLLENGVKSNATSGTHLTTSRSNSVRRGTRSSTSVAMHSRTCSPLETAPTSRTTAETTHLAATHSELAPWELDSNTRSSKKKPNSTHSPDRRSLSPTLTLSNWIRRASRESDKNTTHTSSTNRTTRSSSPSSPAISSSASSPISSLKAI